MNMPEGFNSLSKWADGNKVLVVAPKLSEALDLIKEMAEALHDIINLSKTNKPDEEAPFENAVYARASYALEKLEKWK